MAKTTRNVRSNLKSVGGAIPSGIGADLGATEVLFHRFLATYNTFVQQYPTAGVFPVTSGAMQDRYIAGARSMFDWLLSQGLIVTNWSNKIKAA